MPSPLSEEHTDFISRFLQTSHRNIIGIGKEVLGLRKDGSTFPLDLAVSEVKIDSRRYFTAIARDVTERKHTNREMQCLRYHLNSVIDSLPFIMAEVDAEGKITTWNRQAEKSSGIPQIQAQGKFVKNLFPQFTQQLEQINKVIQQGEPAKFERIPYKAEEETHYADILVYPRKFDNSAIIRVDDTTERVRINEMLIQTEKIFSIGGLAAGVAHEINNPLGVILQSCQNIFRRLSPEFEKNQLTAKSIGTDLQGIHEYLKQRGILRFLEGIQEAGTRAATIVKDMLSFSRRSELRFNPCHINDVLDATIRLARNDYDLKKKYDFKRIILERHYDPNLDKIVCDKTKLEQVIFNLLKNAAEAMTMGGRIKQPIITLSTQKEDNYARIEISDNGPGIDKEIQKRIFDPFFTTKGAGVGTGLGLSVSYFIITHQHKGIMTLESTPGQGTRFIILLPFPRKE